MPPIPTRLAGNVSEMIDSAERRRDDLVNFQIPRLRSCEGPLSLQQSIASELREDMDRLFLQLETLDSYTDGTNEAVISLHKSLVRIRQDYRAALLASKRLIDSRKHTSDRDELLKAAAMSDNRSVDEKATLVLLFLSEKSTVTTKLSDDALMKANNDVTDALRRTVGLMQAELERSVLSSQILDGSTASLLATSSAHDTLGNLMDTSKQLIIALEKTDWLDRLLIIAGLCFFFLVVLFIIKERLVDKGIRIAFWWTRFVPQKTSSGGAFTITDVRSTDVFLSASEMSSSDASPLFAATVSFTETAVSVLATSIASVMATSSSTPELSLLDAVAPDIETNVPAPVHTEL